MPDSLSASSSPQKSVSCEPRTVEKLCWGGIPVKWPAMQWAWPHPLQWGLVGVGMLHLDKLSRAFRFSSHLHSHSSLQSITLYSKLSLLKLRLGFCLLVRTGLIQHPWLISCLELHMCGWAFSVGSTVVQLGWTVSSGDLVFSVQSGERKKLHVFQQMILYKEWLSMYWDLKRQKGTLRYHRGRKYRNQLPVQRLGQNLGDWAPWSWNSDLWGAWWCVGVSEVVWPGWC